VKLLKTGQAPILRNLAAHALANMAIYGTTQFDINISS
jgi:hypothetical protein